MSGYPGQGYSGGYEGGYGGQQGYGDNQGGGYGYSQVPLLRYPARMYN
jgi:hypothetical protein